ncbi:hypothetical protein V6N13_016909 [Hibiscus sabdariffa]|uniref:Uncharacterized protein n=2 Tax=Hibiscus sabdariffa TaxID=183260 RepID=A0ABR1ZEP1_9ROSI
MKLFELPMLMKFQPGGVGKEYFSVLVKYAQETSFVTLGQRVLANPMKIRMHYGHPDVFDRFWFLTQGGSVKLSK